jgi:hypothetical protein
MLAGAERETTLATTRSASRVAHLDMSSAEHRRASSFARIVK